MGVTAARAAAMAGINSAGLRQGGRVEAGRFDLVEESCLKDAGVFGTGEAHGGEDFRREHMEERRRLRRLELSL